MPELPTETINSLAFKTVARVTVVRSVQDQLIGHLETQRLKPGDILPPERELMLILDVGRSSIREALSGLVALGVLSADSRKGYRVRSLNPPRPTLPEGLRAAQIAELFEARSVLEAGIAELACERATEADFAALEACLDSIQKARNARRTTAPAAARFHTLLAAAAHNGLLEEQLQGIRGLMLEVGLQMEQAAHSHFSEEQWEAHKLLLDTLRTRDKVGMRSAMLAHLNRFADEVHDAPLDSITKES